MEYKNENTESRKKLKKEWNEIYTDSRANRT